MKKSLVLLSLLACFLCTAGLAAAATPNMVHTWNLSMNGMQLDGAYESVSGSLQVYGQTGSLFYGAMITNDGKSTQFTGHVSANGALSVTLHSSVQVTLPAGMTAVAPGTCTVIDVNPPQTLQGFTSTDLSGLMQSLEVQDTISVCNGSVSGKTLSCVVNSTGGDTAVITGTHK